MEVLQIPSEKKKDLLMQYAILSAVASTLFFVVLYLGGISWYKNKISFISYLIPVIFAILACRYQKKNDTFLPFRSALRLSFGVFVVTSLATSLFSYLLFQWMDPSFADSLKQLAIEETQKIMENFNVPGDEIDKAIDKLIKQDMFSLKSIFSSFMYSCILNFLISLIIAAIMKKEKEAFSS